MKLTQSETYNGRTFRNDSILLDGKTFIDCQFFDCRISLTRGTFTLRGCEFVRCVFRFIGEAENVSKIVQSLNHQDDAEPAEARPEGREQLEEMAVG